MKKQIKRCILLMTVCLLVVGGWISAGVCSKAAGAGNLHTVTNTTGLNAPEDLPFVEWTLDHHAWTVNDPIPAGEGRETRNADRTMAEHSYWYPYDETVSTGVSYNLPVAGVGQHLYTYKRDGKVAVAEWKVVHKYGSCIHWGGTIDYQWHNVDLIGAKTSICGLAYYSGWGPYCADCGQIVAHLYFYLPKDKVQQIQVIDTTQGFYYLCPGEDCRHLEQGTSMSAHICKSISYNMYRVKYAKNHYDAIGEVNDTYHMYNNETIYRGEVVTGCSNRLSDNKYGFEMNGYVVTGWSLTPGDPYGTPDFALGEELTQNLSEDDYNVGKEDGTGKGVVTLYARWKKVEGTLIVSPGSSEDIAKGASYDDRSAAGATYQSVTKSTSIKGAYLTSYILDESKLTAPKNGTITFDTQGGSYVAPVTVYKELMSWEKSYPFLGRFSEELKKYVFYSKSDGFTDTLTAQWKNGTVILPEASKDDWSFGGWYEDPECTIPVGGGGEPYTPDGDETLYAKWSQLVLTSVTDLAVDGGKGGVDLSWTQEDAREKFYKIYQKKAGSSLWKQIYDAADIGSPSYWPGNVIENVTPGTYTVPIPATGFYEIEAYGAQGGNYGSYAGGKGGYVSARVWLKKGDVITYAVASSSGGGNGNVSGSGAAGGGATVVSSDQLGVLLIAGGGGGASSTKSGGAGGLTSGLIAGSNNGGNGAAGGGSGYRGGMGAVQNYHYHNSSCIKGHTHGSECYTYVPHEHVEGICDGYLCDKYCGGAYWDPVDEEWEFGWCPNCGLDESGGCWTPDNTCTGGWYVFLCTEVSEYKLTCSKAIGSFDGYLCAYRYYDDGYVIEDSASYGGSNYINTAKVISSNENYGQKSGNGSFKITMGEVGFLDSLHLDNVSAHDEAKPNKVSLSSVTIEAAEGNAVKVSFYKPDDKGTVYYHYAESYLATDKDHVLSTTISSPTRNNIVTGVKKYYYILDTNASTVVTSANKQGESSVNAIKVLLNVNVNQYLHVAAVDAAGNVSDTTHILIKPETIPWNLKTEQIAVSGNVGGRDYGSVYPAAGANTYYVKADGETPFDLSFKAYVQGSADVDYQIDNEMFEITASIGTQKFNTELPLSDNNVAGTVVLNPRDFIRSGGGSSILIDARYTTANRQSYAAISNFTQAFSGEPSLNGDVVTIVPHAGASYENADGQDDVKWSDAAADEANKVTLILDGEGPDISGTGPLTGVTELDLGNGDVNLDITATDSLSGLKDLVVIVTNNDAGARTEFTPGADGHIRVTLTETDPLFMGSFSIEILATDNVGNETSIRFNPIFLDLQAQITKVFDDGLSTFARGEGAYLEITTHGYADQVVIEWPAKILAENPTLPTVIDYSLNPVYTHTEKITFIIPLTANDGEQLEIPVKAYKDGVVKEQAPYLEVSGSVLDDIRYRIK